PRPQARARRKRRAEGGGARAGRRRAGEPPGSERRDGVSEPARVSPAAKQGKRGETWGNLLLPEGELRADDFFVFEGDDAGKVYRVERELSWPLDATKRLLYYVPKERRIGS